jgi:hypothetical protein
MEGTAILSSLHTYSREKKTFPAPHAYAKCRLFERRFVMSPSSRFSGGGPIDLLLLHQGKGDASQLSRQDSQGLSFLQSTRLVLL